MTSRKVLLILFFVPSAISFLRLFRIMAATTAASSPPPSTIPPPTPGLPLQCSCTPCVTSARLSPLESPSIPRRSGISSNTATGVLNQEELRLLSSIISLRAPCNLLFFGLRPQLLALSALNAGGRTVFLDDGVRNLRAAAQPPKSQSVQVYKVRYNDTAGRAYDMLRRARSDPACALEAAAGDLRSSACPLALSWLPDEVHQRCWHVIVVDGPSGDRAEAPGRMATIYSAGVMARAGERAAEVLVHDVDRTVEKWYSWEYLCNENLASAKGKLWHFRIPGGNSKFSGFCSDSKVDII
ncbi:hypothetical protein Taro_017315 [Colocasia esculenta]|uniref:Polysaccharide biosynthesis domain-containing protein n=1 Tax=Colocasia esculenta TaxID=4460 RepID=A0A843UQU8_COLES|nr:hypothetical protein [Colocasia esculenta]